MKSTPLARRGLLPAPDTQTNSTSTVDSARTSGTAGRSPSRRLNPSPAGRSLWTRLTVAVCLVVVMVALGSSWISGIRWFDMKTASMGTTAPVGSLVVTKPVPFDDLAVGDVITYTRSVGSEQATYTHRIVERTPQGLVTQGDENAVPDPGARAEADVVGVMVARLTGVGYLLRSLPVLLAGLLAALVLSRVLPRRWRPQLLMLGVSAAACVASVLHRPFFNLASATTTPTETGVAVRMANVGVFPVRAQVPDGPHVDVSPGAFGTLHVAASDAPDGVVNIVPVIHMGVGWWIAFIAVCCLPLLYALATSYRGQPLRQGPGPVRVGGGDTRRRWVVRAAGSVVATVGLVVAAVLVNPANGAFAAQLTNSTNTSSTRAYFTCASMLAATPTNRRFAFGMRPGTTFSTAAGYESDLTGNGRNGTWTSYAGTATPTRTTPATAPCNRDGYSVVNIPTGSSWGLNMGTATANTTASPNTFTIETWFRTASVNQKIIGFGLGTQGSETQYDRHLYIGANGRLYFGVYPNAIKIITSPSAVNDNQWHHAVATLSPAGMALYLDGVQVAADATVTTAENYTGQWRLGYGNLNTWTGLTGTAVPFNGSLGFTAVSYSTVSAGEVRDRYLAGL